jgi:hypothetical protein
VAIVSQVICGAGSGTTTASVESRAVDVLDSNITRSALLSFESRRTSTAYRI